MADFYYISDGTTQCRIMEENGKKSIIFPQGSPLPTPEQQMLAKFYREDNWHIASADEDKPYIEVHTNEYGVEKYIAVSKDQFSNDDQRNVKNFINKLKIKKQQESNQDAIPLGTLPSFKAVGPVVSQDFYLYDTKTSNFVTITATNGEFDLNTVPDNLRSIITKISPDQLEEQQKKENNSGKHFMSIGKDGQYLLIHPDKIYDNEGNPTKLGEIRKNLLTGKIPDATPVKIIPSTNTTKFNPIAKGKELGS